MVVWKVSLYEAGTEWRVLNFKWKIDEKVIEENLLKRFRYDPKISRCEFWIVNNNNKNKKKIFLNAANRSVFMEIQMVGKSVVDRR